MVCAAGSAAWACPAYEALVAGRSAGLARRSAGAFRRPGVRLPSRRRRRRVALEAIVRCPIRDGDPIRADRSQHRRRTCAAGIARPCGRRSSGRLPAASVHAADIVALRVRRRAFPREDAEAIRAIAAAYGGDGRRQPLLVSSVVGQIGHTAGASGMASLLKAALEIDHGEVHRHGGSAAIPCRSWRKEASWPRPPAARRWTQRPTGGGWRASPPAPRPGAPRDPGTGREGARRGRDQRPAAAGGSRGPLPCDAGRRGRWRQRLANLPLRAPPHPTSWSRGWPKPIRHAGGPSLRRPVSSPPTVPAWPLSPPALICWRRNCRLPPSSLADGRRASPPTARHLLSTSGDGPAADRVSLCRARVAVSGHAAATGR